MYMELDDGTNTRPIERRPIPLARSQRIDFELYYRRFIENISIVFFFFFLVNLCYLRKSIYIRELYIYIYL